MYPGARQGGTGVPGVTDRVLDHSPCSGHRFVEAAAAAATVAVLVGAPAKRRSPSWLDPTGRPADYTDERLFADPDPVPAVRELRAGGLERTVATHLVDEITRDLYKTGA